MTFLTGILVGAAIAGIFFYAYVADYRRGRG